MENFEDALKKQYEQQLAANRESVEGAVRQAESALTHHAEQRESGARQAYVRMKQAERELQDRLAETGVNGGASETAQLRLQTQYGSEVAALNDAYERSAEQVRQQVNALRSQGQKQEADVHADYYNRLAQMSLQLQQAEAAARAQAAKAQAAANAKAASAKTAKASPAAASAKQKETAQEKIETKKEKAAQKTAAQQPKHLSPYVTVDGVKMSRADLERRLLAGSVEQDGHGDYRFSYQRYPYWRRSAVK